MNEFLTPEEALAESSKFRNPSEAEERIEEHLRQFDRLKDTGGKIHTAWTDPESEGADLTSADLHVVIDMLTKIRERMFRYYAVHEPVSTDPADQAMDDLNTILMGGTK